MPVSLEVLLMRCSRASLIVLLLGSFLLVVPAAQACNIRTTTVRSGENLGQLFGRWGVGRSDAFVWGRKVSRRMRLSKLHPGDRVEGCLEHTHHGLRLQGVRIVHARHRGVVNVDWPGAWRRQLARARRAHLADEWKSTIPAGIPSGRPELLSFMVAHSLTVDLEAHHVKPLMADAIRDWLQHDSHLPQPLPAGTLVQALFVQPAGMALPILVRVLVYDAGQEHTLYRFVDSHGRMLVVDTHGEAMLPMLVHPAVSFSRISSGWGWRIHPVLHRPEFHKGIDYAAPMGTPVKAIAAGWVQYYGWHGNYGRMVELQHAPGFDSRYGHLLGYARGLHDGEFVHAGQVIGYVGSTGLSTGPHLYLELWLNDHRVDPVRAHVIRPIQLHGAELKRFEQVRSHVRSLLDAEASLVDKTNADSE